MMEFGIEKKCHTNNEKRETKYDSSIPELPNQEKNNACRKRSLQIFVKLEADIIKRVKMKEKNLKRVSQENEETTGGQTI